MILDIPFAKQLALEMTKQDNRSTQFPLFYVYEKHPISVPPMDDYDYEERYFNGDTRGTTDDLCTDCAVKYNNDEDLPDINEFDCACSVLRIKEDDRPAIDTGPFFTEKMAQAHIDANSYHYNKPFIYVNSAWRNYEMQMFMTFIFNLADMEVPACYQQ